MEALSELEAFSYPSSKPTPHPAEPPPKRHRAQPRQDAAALLAQAEEELSISRVEVQGELDANGLKRMILSVEKRINENMALRMKYAEQPERFMESEMALFQELKALHCVAAVPELYPTLVKTKCTPSLLGLLSHDNADISAEVIDLFHEMTDAEDASAADLKVLVDALLDHEAPSLLLAQLSRLDEASEEEAAAVHATLGICENLLEARPESVESLSRAGLVRWVLGRIKGRGFHANKLYAAELLALLLQGAESIRGSLGHEGMLALLTAASQYKRREPSHLEEAELIENVYGSLSLALDHRENQHLFLKAEGIELMILTLKERKYASRPALRVLHAALKDNNANAERFVDIRGFKTLFPLLGSQPPPQPVFARGKKERELSQMQHDEWSMGLLASLFDQLVDERRMRLLGKMAEEGMSKLDRVLALRSKYAGKLDALEEDSEDDDEATYLARVEAGLPTLQLIDLCLGYIATAKAKGCKPLRQRVLTGLYEDGASLHDVWANIEESARLEGGGGEGERGQHFEEMRGAVQALLAKYRDSDAAASGIDASADASDSAGPWPAEDSAGL